jgi:hypothetical protein
VYFYVFQQLKADQATPLYLILVIAVYRPTRNNTPARLRPGITAIMSDHNNLWALLKTWFLRNTLLMNDGSI